MSKTTTQGREMDTSYNEFAEWLKQADSYTLNARLVELGIDGNSERDIKGFSDTYDRISNAIESIETELDRRDPDWPFKDEVEWQNVYPTRI